MMQYNDLTFFTNEPDRDLYGRFSNILKSNTQFFDILVGYFRTSRFFKMYKAMESVEKIRVLVGLNVDKYTVRIIDKAHQDISFTAPTTNEAKEAFSESIEKEFAKSETTCVKVGKNYFDDYLEPLFYTGLNLNRGENGFYPPLHRRIPFLNGGLFEQLDNYDWENNDFKIPNELFSNLEEKGRDLRGIDR